MRISDEMLVCQLLESWVVPFALNNIQQRLKLTGLGHFQHPTKPIVFNFTEELLHCGVFAIMVFVMHLPKILFHAKIGRIVINKVNRANSEQKPEAVISLEVSHLTSPPCPSV
eukprot:TRINITY_DN114464_c0_g1_i1.p2 TRINITY_DN114464_c0_g1~~TRINITY_DN114464_c0_g1_i1.p2  ORF type:complete len:113 (-),score=8.82 TRINITY_DN114464_c0_g1_i1:229-567(-)